MVIYVEYVVIDNMVIDTLILLLTKTFLKLNTKKILIFLSAFLGTIIALISPLFSNIINLLIKIPTSVLMILICFNTKNIKSLFQQLIVFYICSFIMVGACIAICEFLKIEYLIFNGVSYEYKYPIGLALLICSFVFILSKNAVNLIIIKQKNGEYIYDITIINNTKSIDCKAFLDTGNKLLKNGKPISIINFKTFNRLFPNIQIMDLILKKQLSLDNAEYFEVKGITNSQKVLTFQVDEIIIQNNSIKNPILALSIENFSKNTNSDVIISSKLLENEVANN